MILRSSVLDKPSDTVARVFALAGSRCPVQRTYCGTRAEAQGGVFFWISNTLMRFSLLGVCNRMHLGLKHLRCIAQYTFNGKGNLMKIARQRPHDHDVYATEEFRHDAMLHIHARSFVSCHSPGKCTTAMKLSARAPASGSNEADRSGFREGLGEGGFGSSSYE